MARSHPLGDQPDDRTRAGRLGGAILAVAAGGLAVAVPDVRAAAAVALVVGVAGAFVPWARWRPAAVLVLPLAAFVPLASWTGDAGSFPLVGYVAAFGFAGLTQRPRTVAVLGAPALASALGGAAIAGHLDGRRAVDLVAAVLTAVVVGVVVAHVGGDRRRAAGDVERIFAGSRALDAAATSEQVAEALEATLLDLMGADVAFTFAGSGRDARTFVRIGLGPTEGPGGDPTQGAARALVGALAAVSAEEVLGAETVARLVPTLASGDRVTIADAATDPLVEPDRPALAGLGALLVVPLPGDDPRQPIGFVVVGWKRTGVSSSAVATQAVDLLVAEAARVLRRQQHAMQLSQDALTDPLTGLLNRRAIERHLDDLEPGDVVVVLDLDHFSEVNDRHGHAAGDRTLRSLAACLVDTCRKRDWCGRLGGEEFVLVVRGAGANPGKAITRLRDRWHTLDPLTTFSAGVAAHRPDATAWQTLSEADEALYRAKELGRDRVEVRGQQV